MEIRNPCDFCGAQMRYLGNGMLMCSKLYDLALRRHLAGDQRPVDHAALDDDPIVIIAEPNAGSVV